MNNSEFSAMVGAMALGLGVLCFVAVIGVMMWAVVVDINVAMGGG
jgi:hypothetical protein